MITGIHGLIYSDDAPATRAFLRDVLGWPHIEETNSGPGWLIFGSGPSELGVHPTSGTFEGQEYSSPRHHSISLVCADLDQTMAELRGRGAGFSGEVSDLGFGRGVLLQLPAADDILLYEPSYRPAYGR